MHQKRNMNRVIHFEVHAKDQDKQQQFYQDVSGEMKALDKMEIPGVGWLCYCKDSDGNIFRMMQAK